MITEKIEIKAGTVQATITTYLLSDVHRAQSLPPRPAVLVIPGGGYLENCQREAEPIAIAYNARGFNACVLSYSCTPAVFPTALGQAACALAYMREHASEWNIDPDRIFVMGFSAGGHLTASLGVFWEKPFLSALVGKPNDLLKPNGLVLSYPVITSGGYAHHNSIKNLLGKDYNDEKLMELVSLEKQISENTPKTFIWSTWTDEVVPIENTLLFINALRAKGIEFESHIFPKGNHGASLGTMETHMDGSELVLPNVQCWVDFAARWMKEL